MGEPLFNPKPDRLVNAYDIFDKKHRRNLKNFRFRVSTYGILTKNDMVLVQKHPKVSRFGLPGGGVDIGEPLARSLKREFKEETGLVVRVGKLITVTENLFTYGEEDAHSILITYMVKKLGGKLLDGGNNIDTGEVKYIQINKLTKKNTQMIFWKILEEYKRQL